MYFCIKAFPTGPPSNPPLIRPNVAAAIPIATAFSMPILSIVVPNASEYPCPPSIDTAPHIKPSRGVICKNLDKKTAIRF